jgi:hypothetical protein
MRIYRVVGLLGVAVVLGALSSNGGETAAPTPAGPTETSANYFQEMRWRCIGPFRGGRTVAISGVTHEPNVFYMAPVNGGV